MGSLSLKHCVTERVFRAADVRMVLGEQVSRNQYYRFLDFLKSVNVRFYSDFAGAPDLAFHTVDYTADQEDIEDEETSRRLFSLADMVYLALYWRLYNDVSGPRQLQLISRLNQYFVLMEGRVGQALGTACVRLDELIIRFFEGKADPYLAVTTNEAFSLTAREISTKGIPKALVLGANPQTLAEYLDARLFSLGGELLVITFRSILGPATARLRKHSKSADLVPDVPPYVPIEKKSIDLSPQERRLISLMRTSKQELPEWTLDVIEGVPQRVTFTQARSPGRFSVNRTMAEKDTESITSIRSHDGAIKLYHVTKSVSL